MDSKRTAALREPVTLRNGLVLRNRLVKAAMQEDLADKKHRPSEQFDKVYRSWAGGEWGMLLTGNVHVDERFTGGGADTTVPDPSSAEWDAALPQWKAYAQAARDSDTPAVVQLVHPGRQSPGGAGTAKFSEKRVSASDVKLNLGTNFVGHMITSLLFGTPRPLTLDEIRGPKGIVQQFVNGAIFMERAGFSGVELHAAHGYLLAQFLSPVTNKRTDDYGGTAAKRAAIVVEIVRKIRENVSPKFAVGIKLNSVDASQNESSEDIVEQVQLIVDAGIDFVEVSGGTYENPSMAGVNFEKEKAQPQASVVNEKAAAASTPSGPVKASTLKREAYFLEFTATLRKHFPDVVLMVTGGFRTRLGMREAVESGATSLIGIGRPATVFPNAPRDIILNEDLSDDDAVVKLYTPKPPFWLKLVPIKVVATGFGTFYYGAKIRKMATGSHVSGEQ